MTVTIELGLHPHGTTPEAHLRIHGIEAGGMNAREIGTETGTETGIETETEGGGMMIIMTPHLDALLALPREGIAPLVLDALLTVHLHHRQEGDLT